MVEASSIGRLKASSNRSDQQTSTTAVSAAGKALNNTLRQNFPLTSEVFGSSARKNEGTPIIIAETSES